MLLHYRLVAPLGEGGMGVVWKAVDTALEREVAIKVLPEVFAADPERLARFEREAKLLASLNHPNVAAVYGLHEDRGVRFLAMELVRGRSLTDEIVKGLSPSRVLELAGAIADGLAAAHRQQVIHRDLKPDNIMIGEDGRPKVLDFGLAKLGGIAPSPEAATTTQAGSILGTISYMSPEQAQGKPVDPRSDVFSLGIVLYEMTTGRRPFAGDNSVSILTSILRDTPAPVTESQPKAPAPLDRIIRRCLEKEPGARYPDASAVAAALASLRAELASEPQRSGLGLEKAKGRWFAGAAAVAVLIAVLGIVWFRDSARKRQIRIEALSRLSEIVDRIQGLQEGRESWDAFVLARTIDAAAPNDPLLERLRPRFTREITIISDPPGAAAYARYYDDPDGDAILIGTTPLKNVRYPLGFTRVRLTLPGKPDLDDVIWNFSLVGDTWRYQFHAADEVPEGMAFVPGGVFDMFLPGLDHLKPEPTAAFAMDRYEVTHRQYKRFVDAGGYTDATFWKEPFIDAGHELTFTEAMARFTDRTGRPGPATWEVGSYPEGHDDYPVSGVSWYEAAAYAAWAGKSLPTVFHWNRVAFTVASSRIVPMSNLAGSAPVATGGTRSMNRFGVYDLAGNVREWTWRLQRSGLRVRRCVRAARLRPLAAERLPLHP
jgi:predicted Ser/Thr protein kinase